MCCRWTSILKSMKGKTLMKMKRLILGCFIVMNLYSSLVIVGQEVTRVKISGRVIDASTKTPLHFANVFLSNTTLGAATDTTGQFVIHNVPLGTYDLVVTMIGYDNQVRKISASHLEDAGLEFNMKPAVIKGEKLEVTAERPKQWKKDLKQFKSLFFGKSRNAKKCKILNPEVLDFEKDKEKNLFKAIAQSALEIENESLGYHIKFYLETFEFANEKIIHTKGTALFFELTPKNDKEKKKWAKNRLKAYRGSMRHFLVSLMSGRLKGEGFYMRNILRPSKYMDDYFADNIFPEDILQEGLQSHEKELFFQDYLRVVYDQENEPVEYEQESQRTVSTRRSRGYPFRSRLDNNIHERNDYQISWLKMNGLVPVKCNDLGIIDEPKALRTFGFWAWERFGDELPLDYVAEK